MQMIYARWLYRRLKMMIIMAVAMMAASLAGAETALKTPHPDLKPIDVVRTQLLALQQNDVPSPDFGIRQTWAFAHPDNRAVTGPLDRFAEMIKAPLYQPLINHKRHTITEQNRSPDWVQFKVMMEDEQGQVLSFAWVVKTASTPPFENCWMTSAVSAPVLAGQGS